MIEEALLQRIRAIELFTKRPSNQLFNGATVSHHKGRGMSFSEVRNYAVGDEVRFIDWNVTARFKEPFVKVFEEERDQQLLLIIDVSKSMQLLHNAHSKWYKTVELCAHLIFSAAHKKDRFGALLVSDQEELFIPMKSGMGHAHHLLRKLVHFKAISNKTDLSVGLKGAIKHLKNRALCCFISDFTDIELHKSLCYAVNKKHDLVTFQVSDPSEFELPKLGYLPVEHIEDESCSKWLNLNDSLFQANYNTLQLQRNEQLNWFFQNSGIDYHHFDTFTDMSEQVKTFFTGRK